MVIVRYENFGESVFTGKASGRGHPGGVGIAPLIDAVSSRISMLQGGRRYRSARVYQCSSRSSPMDSIWRRLVLLQFKKPE